MASNTGLLCWFPPLRLQVIPRVRQRLRLLVLSGTAEKRVGEAIRAFREKFGGGVGGFAVRSYTFSGLVLEIIILYGCGSKLQNWGKPQVFVFGSICQGASLVLVLDPQPHVLWFWFWDFPWPHDPGSFILI